MVDFMKARFERDPSIVHREVAGETILVPVRRNVADMESIYTLDGVGAFVWGLLDGQRSVGEIKSAILDEYEASPEVAEADLLEFLGQLEEIGAIRRA